MFGNSIKMDPTQNGPYAKKQQTTVVEFANNKGADQPGYPRNLISTFVICLLESSISELASSKISIFYIVSVAELAGLNLALSKTLKTGFLASRPINIVCHSNAV